MNGKTAKALRHLAPRLDVKYSALKADYKKRIKGLQALVTDTKKVLKDQRTDASERKVQRHVLGWHVSE